MAQAKGDELTSKAGCYSELCGYKASLTTLGELALLRCQRLACPTETAQLRSARRRLLNQRAQALQRLFGRLLEGEPFVVLDQDLT